MVGVGRQVVRTRAGRANRSRPGHARGPDRGDADCSARPAGAISADTEGVRLRQGPRLAAVGKDRSPGRRDSADRGNRERGPVIEQGARRRSHGHHDDVERSRRRAHERTRHDDRHDSGHVTANALVADDRAPDNRPPDDPDDNATHLAASTDPGAHATDDIARHAARARHRPRRFVLFTSRGDGGDLGGHADDLLGPFRERCSLHGTVSAILLIGAPGKAYVLAAFTRLAPPRAARFCGRRDPDRSRDRGRHLRRGARRRAIEGHEREWRYGDDRTRYIDIDIDIDEVGGAAPRHNVANTILDDDTASKLIPLTIAATTHEDTYNRDAEFGGFVDLDGCKDDVSPKSCYDVGGPVTYTRPSTAR